MTLSPVQEAWSRYVRHATTCTHCKDIDRGRCETAGVLWEAYQAQTDEAYRRLGNGTA